MAKKRFIDYEGRALEAMEQGKVAEAQVWATLWQGSMAQGAREHLKDMDNSLAEMRTHTYYIHAELERISNNME